jgi:hypothetical protein
MAVPFFVTYPHTSSTEDAKIIIQVIEGIVLYWRDSSIANGKLDIVQLQVIHKILQFAIAVAGAEITSCYGTYLPCAVHEIGALILILAYQAGKRML